LKNKTIKFDIKHQEENVVFNKFKSILGVPGEILIKTISAKAIHDNEKKPEQCRILFSNYQIYKTNLKWNLEQVVKMEEIYKIVLIRDHLQFFILTRFGTL
jgi:hypothetical protein